MAPSHRRILSHAVIVAIVAAVSLAGCGRKGPLEAPLAYAADDSAVAAKASPASKPDTSRIFDKLLD